MFTDRVAAWRVAQARLKHYKNLEGDLRREICEEMFDGRVGKFTEKLEFEGDGVVFVVKATSVVNRKVDEEMLHQLYQDGHLTDNDNLCFFRKLAIIDKALNARPANSNVWKAITEKPGMPKLEITEHED
jgi:hypothetical protein